MKKLLLLAPVIAAILVVLASCGPTSQQAVDYNDAIILKQIAIFDAINELDAAYENYVPEEMDAAMEEALLVTNDGIAFLDGLEPFDGSTEFKDHAMELFKVYKNVLENEFSRMIEIYKLPEDLYTQDEMDEWEELYDDAYDRMNKALQVFNLYQATFAEKYNFVIQASE
ncbi:MAG: hypothetical protein ABIJ16_06290 [Bacteroidota bacterium]